MTGIWDAAIPIVIFGSGALIVKMVLDHKIRQKLIEKGMVDEKAKFLNFASEAQYAPSSLKWGLVFFLMGVAIILTRAFMEDAPPEVWFGALFIAAGVGLLIYYLIADIERKKRDREHPRP